MNRIFLGGVDIVQGTDAAFVEARAKAITGWRLRDNVCLIMSLDGTVGAGMYAGKPRTYCFARIDTNQVDNTHSLLNLCWTFPTVDMMQTFFRALGRQEEAENDLAVLSYSGAVNFFSYDEKWVLDLLNRAARKHLPTAFHNLGVFYDNRKEARRAQSYHRLAEQRRPIAIRSPSSPPLRASETISAVRAAFRASSSVHALAACIRSNASSE